MDGRKASGLAFSLGGKISYYCGGKRYKTDETNAVILPEGSVYTLKCEKSGYFPLINFHTAEELGKEPIVIPISEKSVLISLFEDLRINMQKHGSAFRSAELINGIFARLTVGEKKEDDLCLKIKRYIAENYQSAGLSNSEIAFAVGISEVYLRKLFTAKAGASPHKYISETRIAKAKRLLSETPKTVGEIAEACGFQSIYNFCRAFKKATGSTPTEYRLSSNI